MDWDNLGTDLELERLLCKRNALLAKFITHIANLCHINEHDDVTIHSTSLDWIFDYLKKHYGLETKGANFMNIAEHVFKKGTLVLQVLPFLTHYHCPSLEGQAPKQLTNQQQYKSYDLNIPGGGQYTQNHP